MPYTTDEDKITYDYMSGIANSIVQANIDLVEVTKLLTYLDEKDRRRGTDWKTLFPWLVEYKKICGTVK
jgi:hypothetical protein